MEISAVNHDHHYCRPDLSVMKYTQRTYGGYPRIGSDNGGSDTVRDVFICDIDGSGHG